MGEKSFWVENEKLEIFKLEFSKQLNGDLEIFTVKSVKRAEINNTPSVAQKRFWSPSMPEAWNIQPKLITLVIIHWSVFLSFFIFGHLCYYLIYV